MEAKSGAMQFGLDWCGVFIRGEDAFNYFLGLKRALEQYDFDSITQARLKALAKLLATSREREREQPDVLMQRMLPFDEAVQKEGEKGHG